MVRAAIVGLSVAAVISAGAEESHWAYAPLRSTEAKSSVDRFVDAKLGEAGMTAAPEADRRTLIRRLSYDLLGLPPTPEEVERFVRDRRADAYERVVDRYLSSPHFGERQARRWLDLVRWGESSGFEQNTVWREIWPYRDWLIHSFNRDLPYDEFVRLQLAGDVLHPNDPLAVTATGFLACGPYDKIGNEGGTESMQQMTRQTELGDLVGTISQTFLGLSLDCARCHDHKFDALSQKDYFQVAASFGGTRVGMRENGKGARPGELEDRLKVLAKEIAALEEQRSRLSDQLGGALARRYGRSADGQVAHESYAELVRADGPLGYWRFQESTEKETATNLGSVGEKAAGKFEGVDLAQESLLAQEGDFAIRIRPGRRVVVPPFEKFAGGTGFTVEFLIMLEEDPPPGYRAVVGDGESGEDFNLMVYLAEGKIRAHLRTENGNRAVDSVERLAKGSLTHVVTRWDAERGDLSIFLNGSRAESTTSIGKLPDRGAPVNTDNGLFFGGNERGTDSPVALLDEVALYNKPLERARIALHAHTAGIAGARTWKWDGVLAVLEGEEIDRSAALFDLERELSQKRLLLGLARKRTIRGNAPSQPPVFHILDRGDYRKRGAVVRAGGIATVGSGTDFGLKPDAPEGERRVRFAKWLTRTENNPLFARVIVNRLWQDHFGTGLVATPNDFGRQGAPPSHPELLDWLAQQLIESGWSLKSLRRLIVTSRAYRRGLRRELFSNDPGNRLLAGRVPRRLEAEALRDSLYLVSGRLNPRIGGAPYLDVTIKTRGHAHHYHPADDSFPFARRSLYRLWARSGPSPFLAAFDCPNTSVRTPVRATTTTPLQALALLNSPLADELAQAMTERVERLGGKNAEDRIRAIYQHALQRAPSGEELAAALPFAAEHGLREFCLVLFNSNEFVYVD